MTFIRKRSQKWHFLSELYLGVELSTTDFGTDGAQSLFAFGSRRGRENGVGGLVDEGYVSQRIIKDKARWGDNRARSLYSITAKGRKLFEEAV